MSLDVLAVAAHPDDIELSCCGTMIKMAQAGYRTGIVDLTLGEMSTRGDLETRAKETEEASSILGLSVRENLKLPDSKFDAGLENRLKLIEVYRRHQPKLILAPTWIVRHFDHETASRLSREAAFYSGLRKIDTGQEPFRPKGILFYMCRLDFEPTLIVDVTDQFELKMKAIKAFQSQVFSPDSSFAGQEETLISSQGFMENIEVRSRHYGHRIGVRHGEPFFMRGVPAVQDPMSVLGGEY